MSSAPEIVTRAAQPYVAIRTQVTMEDLGMVVPPLNQEVFAWLGGRGVAPAGAPFWKYNVIDMAGKLEVEAGAPVAAAVQAMTAWCPASSRPGGTPRSPT